MSRGATLNTKPYTLQPAWEKNWNLNNARARDFQEYDSHKGENSHPGLANTRNNKLQKCLETCWTCSGTLLLWEKPSLWDAASAPSAPELQSQQTQLEIAKSNANTTQYCRNQRFGDEGGPRFFFQRGSSENTRSYYGFRNLLCSREALHAIPAIIYRLHLFSSTVTIVHPGDEFHHRYFSRTDLNDV